MKARRLQHRTVTITEERARELWKGRIEQLIADLQESVTELQEALKAPLATTERVLEAVEEGEPGYDDAPYEVSYNVHPMVFTKPPLQ